MKTRRNPISIAKQVKKMVELSDTRVSMKTKIKKISIGLLLFAITVNSAHAKIVFKNEYLIEEDGTEAFVIDSGDDVSGDLVLQFGASLAETITFDTADTEFEFSDSALINGNLEVDNGTSNTNIIIEKDDTTEGRLSFELAGTEVGSIVHNAAEEIVFTNGTADADFLFNASVAGVPTDFIRINAGTGQVQVLPVVTGPTLEAHGDTAIGGGLAAQEDGTSEYLEINAQSDSWFVGVQNEAAAADSDFFVGLGSAEDGIFHIENDGDVGIGTATPGGQLQVIGAPILFNSPTLTDEEFHISEAAGSSDVGLSLEHTSGQAFELHSNSNSTFEIKNGPETTTYLSIDGGTSAITFGGALDINGTIFTLDADNAGAGADVDIVANQGTDSDGTLRYNATLNQWELSNDGGTFQAIGTRVPDLYHYIDTTADAIVAANSTTDYWDEGAENGTQHPNITPTLATSEILVMMSVSFDPNGNADESDVVRIERNIGSDPTCGSSTQVGDQVGWLTSDNDVDGASAIYVDAPATTSQVFYTLCSDAESTDTGGSIIEIQFTLYEINDASDLAEVYATNDTSLISGDVVSFDPELRVGVKKTEKAYDPKVLGVVSTKPAETIGGTGGEGKAAVPIALSGRVPIKVTTENGNIEPGDLLVPSSMPGVAMKASKPGYIIGRAFGHYSGEDVGVVLGFVGTHFADPGVLDVNE